MRQCRRCRWRPVTFSFERDSFLVDQHFLLRRKRCRRRRSSLLVLELSGHLCERCCVDDVRVVEALELLHRCHCLCVLRRHDVGVRKHRRCRRERRCTSGKIHRSPINPPPRTRNDLAGKEISGRERVFPEAAERARELGQRAESGHTGKL